MYTAFTVTPSKKEKGVLRIWAEHNSGDGWIRGGNFVDLYPVPGFLVAVHALSRKPFAVFQDLDHCCKSLEKQYGIKPVINP